MLMMRNMLLTMKNMLLPDEKHDVDDKVDSALTLLECRMQKLDNVLGTNYGSFWIITKVGQVRITL